ncbi:MAG: hypothetical protein U0176_17025 [Bacteroidia bacterium]
MSTRKRNPGERKPTPTLSEQVNALGDGEFADVIEMVTREGYVPAYAELYLWHRGRLPYNPDAEQADMGRYHLPSLRKDALRRLRQCLAELRSGMHQLFMAWERSLDSEPMVHPKEMMEAIQAAKAHAAKRGYLERILRLLAFEECVARAYLKGFALDRCLSRIAAEVEQANANLLLAPQLSYYRREYLEAVRQGFYATGLIDRDRVAAYLGSDFYQLDVSGYPARLTVDKLLIDEFFLFLSDHITEACDIANKIHRLHRSGGLLSPRDHASLLRRLANYYDQLSDRDGIRRVISHFEEIQPEKAEHFQIYMSKYLNTLCFLSFDIDDESIATKAHVLYEKHQLQLHALPEGNEKLSMMLFILYYKIAGGKVAEARELFDHLYRFADQRPPLIYRVQFMVAHLILLFEEGAGDEMRTFSKNYKRIMEKSMPSTLPALRLLGFLSKHVNRNYPIAMLEQYESLCDSVREFEKTPGFERSLIYSPIKTWLARIALRNHR